MSGVSAVEGLHIPGQSLHSPLESGALGAWHNIVVEVLHGYTAGTLLDPQTQASHTLAEVALVNVTSHSPRGSAKCTVTAGVVLTPHAHREGSPPSVWQEGWARL